MTKLDRGTFVKALEHAAKSKNMGCDITLRCLLGFLQGAADYASDTEILALIKSFDIQNDQKEDISHDNTI